MSITNLSNSNYSGTSSETSETLSIDDINQNTVSTPTGTLTLNSRIPKSWQRMSNLNNEKDESKRPPWRAVSVSTLPKPDKSAILRAKLLDASRRLRAAKVSVSVQTDFEPTKLMKEVQLGVQSDLVMYKDASVLTDGSCMRTRDGPNEFVLTYSVAQLTDAVPVVNASTQTLLLKYPADGFMDCCLRGGESIFDTAQRKLLQQLTQIRRGNGQLDSFNDIFRNKEMLGVPPCLQQNLSCWNLGCGVIESKIGQKFEPYIIYPTDTLNASYAASDQLRSLLNAIDEILKESNALIEVVYGTKLCHNPVKSKITSFCTTNNTTQKTKHPKYYFPSEHWVPIIEEQEKRLEEMKQRLKRGKRHNLKNTHTPH